MTTLNKLNEHLFEQLDRLSKAKSGELEQEIERAKALEGISTKVIDAHNTQLQAVKLIAEYNGLNENQKTPLIGTGD